MASWQANKAGQSGLERGASVMSTDSMGSRFAWAQVYGLPPRLGVGETPFPPVALLNRVVGNGGKGCRATAELRARRAVQSA